MFKHEKMLFHPVAVERPNPQYAALLQEQLGGGNGELKAAMQYMSQSFRIKDPEIKDLFLDIAAEELGHMEMVAQTINLLNDHDVDAAGSSPVASTSREPRHAIRVVEVLLFYIFRLAFEAGYEYPYQKNIHFGCSFLFSTKNSLSVLLPTHYAIMKLQKKITTTFQRRIIMSIFGNLFDFNGDGETDIFEEMMGIDFVENEERRRKREECKHYGYDCDGDDCDDCECDDCDCDDDCDDCDCCYEEDDEEDDYEDDEEEYDDDYDDDDF